MIGSLYPDRVLESLTCEEFDQLEQYDKVLPIDHGPRMLGFIAYLLGQQLIDGVDNGNLMVSCMPWIDVTAAEPASGKSAVASVQRGK